MKGDVEAVVYDAPNLLYYANGEGKGKVTVVGKIFEPQDYGLALPQGSPLREKINLAILKLIESGELGRIKMKWFGDKSSRYGNEYWSLEHWSIVVLEKGIRYYAFNTPKHQP